MPDPKTLARRAIATLRAAKDPSVAAQMQAYFKPQEQVRFYGVKMSRVQAIQRDLYGELRQRWTISDATEFCDVLVREPFVESKALGVLLLSRFHKQFRPALLRTVKSWLRADHCDNWAVTDALSSLVIARLLERFPELVPELTRWTSSRNLWVRRAAAVGLVPLARNGTHLAVAYQVATSLLDDKEDLLHKAMGWLLREAGKTDPARLEAFLLARGPRIPRTALRYAIERFPDARRRALLARTKAMNS